MMTALSRILPPPQYLTMPNIGVDISDTSLKYIQFKPTTKAGAPRELAQWGDMEIPAGTVAQGQVTDPEQLASVLREFKAQTNAEYIRVSLPEERAYLFETEIRRSTPNNELRGLLEFRLEENVPIPSRDVMFDYMVLPGEDNATNAQVVVAAYARETIDHYYNACVTAGLHPVAFEVEAQAMARAVIPQDMKRVAMLVDFGKTRTGIGIVQDGILLYTSTIDIGGDQLSQALRRQLGAETAESELTQIKNTQGLVRGINDTTVRDALLSTISVIRDELATRMQYWHMSHGNSHERRIGSVVLCGGSANLKGLPAYLTESLGIPVTRGNVWENSLSLEDTVPPIDRYHSFGYATAIGLALKHSA